MEYVVVARALSERGEVVLRRRRDPAAPEGAPAELELRVNGVFVMDTLETTSEVALARAALQQVQDPSVVLVGGLGLGFTVHEVLSDHRVRHVVVAEIEDALVRWFRDGTIPHGGHYLADQRVTVSIGDVRQVVAEASPASFDLVLLDVDNGPDFLVHPGNAALYERDGLAAARAALRAGGLLVVWSSHVAPALRAALEQVAALGEVVGEELLEVRREGRAFHYALYSLRRSAGPERMST